MLFVAPAIISRMSTGRRVLVVDDDARLGASLRRALAYEGHAVEVASDGPGALVAARDRPPDLVVLDVMLPGLDGVEVCRRLRAGGAGSDVPILMLTARDAISDRVAGLDAGADDYLVKPFAPEELLARVRALLRRTYGERAAYVGGQLTLNPSGRRAERIARLSGRIRLTRSASVNSSKAQRSCTCCFGISNVWPVVAGVVGKKAKDEEDSNTMRAGDRPATIAQNAHDPSANESLSPDSTVSGSACDTTVTLAVGVSRGFRT